MVVLLLGALWLAAPAQAGPTTSGTVEEPATVFFREVTGAASPAHRELVGQLITGSLAGRRGIEVASRREVESLLAGFAEEERAACPRGDCPRGDITEELAGALGADHLVTARLDELDGLLGLSLGLIDTRSAEPLERVSFEAADVAELARLLTPAIHNLLRPLLGGPEREIPAPTRVRRMGDAGSLKAAATVGGAAFGSAVACGALPAAVVGGGVLFALGQLPVLGNTVPCLSPLLCVPCAVGAATVAGAELADHVDGYQAHHLRAAATGAVALLASGLAAAASFGAAQIAWTGTAVALYGGLTPVYTPYWWAGTLVYFATMGLSLVAGAALTAALVGFTYALGIALVDDVPRAREESGLPARRRERAAPSQRF